MEESLCSGKTLELLYIRGYLEDVRTKLKTWAMRGRVTGNVNLTNEIGMSSRPTALDFISEIALCTSIRVAFLVLAASRAEVCES